MRLAIYPGSFDPVTNGHLDIMQRACTLFNNLIVAVAFNDQKHDSTLFFDRRENRTAPANVRSQSENPGGQTRGASRRFCQAGKGRCDRSRSSSDLRFRVRISNGTNEPEDGADAGDHIHDAKGGVHLYQLRIVKEIARLGGNVQSFVPDCVAQTLAKKFPS